VAEVNVPVGPLVTVTTPFANEGVPVEVSVSWSQLLSSAVDEFALEDIAW